jgi:hypothetical protein
MIARAQALEALARERVGSRVEGAAGGIAVAA